MSTQETDAAHALLTRAESLYHDALKGEAVPPVELITWIPVAEQMPGGEWVLVCDPDGVSVACLMNGSVACLMNGSEERERRWMTFETESDIGFVTHVTHWAELPKGPGK